MWSSEYSNVGKEEIGRPRKEGGRFIPAVFPSVLDTPQVPKNARKNGGGIHEKQGEHLLKLNPRKAVGWHLFQRLWVARSKLLHTLEVMGSQDTKLRVDGAAGSVDQAAQQHHHIESLPSPSSSPKLHSQFWDS